MITAVAKFQLVDSANSDLEMVRTELGKKQEELEGMRIEYSELQVCISDWKQIMVTYFV